MTKRYLIVGVISLLAALSAGSAPAGATYAGADGRIAFGMSTSGADFEIFSVLPNGSNLRQLTDIHGFNACANYSPNGRSIAWCSGTAGQSSEIWAMKANGKDQHQLTHIGGNMTFPNYSPDGTRIAFSGTSPGDRKQAIYVIGANGSGLVRLTDDSSDNFYPAWSPDGTKIAFVSNRTRPSQIWVMNADGTVPVQLTTLAFPKQQLPDWSPDGKQIAFSSVDADGVPDIFIINSNGTGLKRLTHNEGVNIAPRWSPTGARIAFFTIRNGQDRTVYVMNPDGSDQHAVHPGGAQLAPSWQPLPIDGASD